MTEIKDLVLFCRALRERGLSVTPAEVVTAATVLQVIDTSDRDEVFLSLRSVLTTSVDDFPTFEELFEMFWSASPRKLVEREPVVSMRRRNVSPPKGLAFFLEHWTPSQPTDGKPVNVPGADATESHAHKDFSEFSHEELEEISRLARRIVRRLARQPSRRWQPTRRGHRVNLQTLAATVAKNRRRTDRSRFQTTPPKADEARCHLRCVWIDGHVQSTAVAVCLWTPKQFRKSRIVCFCHLAIEDNGRAEEQDVPACARSSVDRAWRDGQVARGSVRVSQRSMISGCGASTGAP